MYLKQMIKGITLFDEIISIVKAKKIVSSKKLRCRWEYERNKKCLLQ